MHVVSRGVAGLLVGAILVSAGCSSGKAVSSAAAREGITEEEYQKVTPGMPLTEVAKLLDSRHLDDAFTVGEGITIHGPNGEACDRVQYYRARWTRPEERAAIYYKDLKVVAKAIKVPGKSKDGGTVVEASGAAKK